MTEPMIIITSSIVTARLCGVFVWDTAAWLSFGERMWAEMMMSLRQQPSHLRLLGIDSEWFKNSPLSVVQFATSTHCFVLHIAYFDGRLFPTAVMEALCDTSIIKCGVGIKNDVSRIQQEQNITLQSVMDVAEYSIFLRLHDGPKTNLQVLAESVATLTIEKNHSITRSNWELPLSQSQINYAAEDALASYLIGKNIMIKASETFDMTTSSFNVAQWLQQTSPAAGRELKNMLRVHAFRRSEEKKKKGPPSTSSKSKVRVLDRQGNFLFECSPGRAKFYVLEKSLAVITKHANDNPSKAFEIQLLFDPKVKTRLCTHYSLGHCELEEQCPYAHGMTELQPDSAALLESQVPSCACCLGTKGLVRHAITPPSFRKFMPLPERHPQPDDFLPVCQQCMSALRSYYDKEMTQCYKEAEELNTVMFSLDTVVKCTVYARLLSNTHQLQQIPFNRCEEIQRFVMENWKSTLFEHFNPDFEICDPVELNAAFLQRLGAIVPGDVRAKVTMMVLVGDDLEKARQFNKRWGDCCFSKLGMVEKKSNHMSPDDWTAYRNQSTVPVSDADYDALLRSELTDKAVCDTNMV